MKVKVIMNFNSINTHTQINMDHTVIYAYSVHNTKLNPINEHSNIVGL